MKLSIIIVTHNSSASIGHCLRLIEETGVRQHAEVLVLDNNSSDSTAGLVASGFPWVRLEAHDQNLGFARACNRGVALSRGDFLLFLNPDAFLVGDCVQECVNYLGSNRTAGIVACRLLNEDGTLQQSWSVFPTMFNLARRHAPVSRKGWSSVSEQQNDRTVEWVIGAFLMTRRDIFPSSSVFDEDYFLYGEDMDLCYRVQRVGLKVILLTHVHAIHLGQAEWTPQRLEPVYDAICLFLRKHRGYALSILAAAMLGVLLAGRTFRGSAPPSALRMGWRVMLRTASRLSLAGGPVVKG